MQESRQLLQLQDNDQRVSRLHPLIYSVLYDPKRHNRNFFPFLQHSIHQLIDTFDEMDGDECLKW